MGILEDLVNEIEDPVVDEGFDEQHKVPIALDRAEQLKVLQRLTDAWRRRDPGELVTAAPPGEERFEERAGDRVGEHSQRRQAPGAAAGESQDLGCARVSEGERRTVSVDQATLDELRDRSGQRRGGGIGLQAMELVGGCGLARQALEQ